MQTNKIQYKFQKDVTLQHNTVNTTYSQQLTSNKKHQKTTAARTRGEGRQETRLISIDLQTIVKFFPLYFIGF